jgi:hypothetical protein
VYSIGERGIAHSAERFGRNRSDHINVYSIGACSVCITSASVEFPTVSISVSWAYVDNAVFPCRPQDDDADVRGDDTAEDDVADLLECFCSGKERVLALVIVTQWACEMRRMHGHQ